MILLEPAGALTNGDEKNKIEFNGPKFASAISGSDLSRDEPGRSPGSHF